MNKEQKTAPEDESVVPAEAETGAVAEEGNESGEPGHEELQGLLTDARAKADEHWDQCLRLQAEMDNLRKRGERDLVNAHKFALDKIAAELIPVKDSLEMGLAAAGENHDVQKLIEGSELTLKMFESVLDKFNINEINPINEKFNPEYHEAMSMQERDDVEPNTVVVVMQKGYMLNDRLVRPAMVMVSKAPAGSTLDEQA
ncbi:Heat shock protein GrpE [hydrothermal vent metagenome]|uniref:Heat shock protein GrpE n=1 Tax=hydrothermal vent metagenome TaxID=652676 RepID=A0A3B0XX89_9ZZZZ